MLHFECPSCKAKCEAAESTAGMTVACPRCRKQVVVPNRSTTPDSAGTWFRNVILVLVGLALVGFVIMLAIPNEPGGAGNKAVSSGTNPGVVMDTSMGAIKIELFADKAPISVENFLKYVDAKHYDGTIFHRVMDGFMIQGGGFDAASRREKKTRGPIRNESDNGLRNEIGTIAMARTDDPDSATAQFYINVADNQSLNGGLGNRRGYAVFGQVIEGMDVVNRIKAVPTENVGGAFTNAPRQDVVIRSIRRVDAK